MNVLLAGQAFSFSIKLTAGLFLFLRWWRYRRDSLIFWAFFFLSSSFSIVSEILGFGIGVPLFQALGVSFLTAGIVSFLDEEALGFSTKYLKVAALVLPVTVSTYVVLYALLHSLVTSKPNPLYLSFGISGIFYAIAGVVFWTVRRFYPRTGAILSVTLVAHGLHKMDYPFLRPVGWFAPIGFAIGAFLTMIEVLAFVKMVLSERFEYVVPEDRPPLVRKGVFLISPSEFSNYVEALSDFPVLAFTRRRDFPEAWEVHLLTAVEGAGNVGPTQLHRIIEKTRSYLAEAHREEVIGVVVIEGLEYLLMYNDFRSVLKFLATLSDYVALYGGMLVLVFDEKSLEEKQLKTLRQVLNVGGIK
ncbi:DUF835 domain-containing protein [Thermococcus sp.]|uniref:DUF835 domain-containing protein n=1 Tax=Thermococcus sp. TaxID=35749 RepID=UPI0025F33BEA|nr:DUF835 domain-containing protein [Thermococcus sp.]